MEVNQEIFEKLKTEKLNLDKEGFVIIGLFGSFARGEEKEDSDVDILFELKEEFYQKFIGWAITREIENYKFKLEKKFNRKVDLVNRKALSKIGQKYILPELVYV